MELEPIHFEAAKILGRGGTELEAATAANVSRSAISRWKRDGDFKAAILAVSDPVRTAIASHATMADVFELIPERESKLVLKLERIAIKLGEVLESRLDELEPSIDDIPTRLLPQFLRAYIECVSAIQATLDRLSGYDLIVQELGKNGKNGQDTSKSSQD